MPICRSVRHSAPSEFIRVRVRRAERLNDVCPLKIVFEIDAEEQVVGPPGLGVTVELHAGTPVVVDQSIADRFVVLQPVQGGGVTRQSIGVERIARARFEARFQDLGGDTAIVHHADEVDSVRRSRQTAAAVGKMRLEFGLVECVPGQFVLQHAHGGRAGFDGFHNAAEVGRAELAEFRADEKVRRSERRQLLAGLVADQDRQHLRGDVQRGVELLRFVQRKLDVHRDDDVDVHLAHGIDRHVATEATVDQGAPVDADR